MWAVLADGIDCYSRMPMAPLSASAPNSKEPRAGAAHRLDSPFSFTNLCETFGYDPAGCPPALSTGAQQRRHALRRPALPPVTLHAAA